MWILRFNPEIHLPVELQLLHEARIGSNEASLRLHPLKRARVADFVFLHNIRNHDCRTTTDTKIAATSDQNEKFTKVLTWGRERGYIPVDKDIPFGFQSILDKLYAFVDYVQKVFFWHVGDCKDRKGEMSASLG